MNLAGTPDITTHFLLMSPMLLLPSQNVGLLATYPLRNLIIPDPPQFFESPIP